MKILTIDLKGEWVLTHYADKKLPIDLIKDELAKAYQFDVQDCNFSMLRVKIKNQVTESVLRNKIANIISVNYPEKDIAKVYSVSVASVNDGDEKDKPISEKQFDELLATITQESMSELESMTSGDDKYEADKKAAKSPVDTVLEKIDGLVGVEEFKALAHEIAAISPEVISRKTVEVFLSQCYLFAVGDGCGMTTCLNLLSELLDVLKVKTLRRYNTVVELELPPVRDDMQPFEKAIEWLDKGVNDEIRILSVDISEWMNATESRHFKQFLREVERHSNQFVVVFRVPFVDKDILERLKYSLNDLLYVRTVALPPYTQAEMQACATEQLKEYGFDMQDESCNYFNQRMSLEKSDGKFYGLNTVKKVVRELVYKKQLHNAKSKTSSSTITESDAKQICLGDFDNAVTGEQQLKALIGNEQIRQHLDEILAQIELALKSGTERPCIHMRFVGNPGTGKTTVARILGKILKERGILRVGNFYEYAGRDFCGRYIGETAPKTAAMCRDAYGSVLFIDEAYSLFRGDNDSRDFGREAIDTLIAEMENHRNDFVVIMAGYTDDMNTLMRGNLGLASRMPYTIEFPNFTRDQLYEIFVSLVKSKFKYQDDLFEAARSFFTSLPDELLKAKEFSNARYVRNLFERTWAKASMRCQLAGETEVVLTRDDFERASADKEFTANASVKRARIGF